MTVLDALRAELTAATNRLLATTTAMSGSDVTAPSLLPGWTRGHVLTHIARNADSHVNLVTWAKTGMYTPQYPTLGAREAEIEQGAGRPLEEQHADLAAGAARLDEAVGAMPAEAWTATVQGMRPPEHPAWYLLVRRIREVEIHHVDLDAGYTWADWPEAFVRRELHDAMATWPHADSAVGAVHADDRTWTGLGDGPAVEGAAPAVLAWVTGRLKEADLGTAVRLAEGGQGSRERRTEDGQAGLAGDGGGEAGRMTLEGPRLAGRPPAAPRWLTMPAPPGLPATPPEEYP
ncbi:maleylpyruvate isomerase N-terminal domain-containing protein [Sphaerisporangium perillae]|uniref:maleylpyruvate isomerase N-terminal domain-containing protein n=1 Tax=Sphaerisporangium perillae TaxID=2935860 RepID=UPI00200BCA1F|nr:maleylpyruvate isomerase family mycothiol-dependent enzyme [Sphaerisporangium perillae]